MTVHPLSSSRVSISLTKGVYTLYLKGEGSLETSREVQAFISKLIKKGRSHIILNFEQCPYINSIFAGTLLGLTQRLQKKHRWKLGLEGLNPSVKGTLTTLGIQHAFTLPRRQARGRSGRLSRQRRPAPAVRPANALRNKLAAAEHVYSAHLKLMKQAPKNRQRFQKLTELLEEDITRLRKKVKTNRSG